MLKMNKNQDLEKLTGLNLGRFPNSNALGK